MSSYQKSTINLTPSGPQINSARQSSQNKDPTKTVQTYFKSFSTIETPRMKAQQQASYRNFQNVSLSKNNLSSDSNDKKLIKTAIAKYPSKNPVTSIQYMELPGKDCLQKKFQSSSTSRKDKSLSAKRADKKRDNSHNLPNDCNDEGSGGVHERLKMASPGTKFSEGKARLTTY